MPLKKVKIQGDNTMARHKNKKTILLKNGLIVDGTGREAYTGNVLIRGGEISSVSKREIKTSGQTIDCTGRVISPGFIDFHSHNDWFLPNMKRTDYKTPFTAQGITTFVTGNCGFGAGGLKKNSEHMHHIEDNLFKAGIPELKWATMKEYFGHLNKLGLSHNVINLAGHGTTRTSIRGWEPSPMNKDEMKELLSLLEQSMDEGGHGVSLGLQYAPGQFATMDELKEVAKLVKKKNKILTVHKKAFSYISGDYPMKPFGKAHNLIALEEMIKLARETGVRLQISHLIFVGQKTWKTMDRALKLIDDARNEGVDIMFDTYGHHCGASIITVLLPEWFMAEMPEALDSKSMVRKVRMLANISFFLLGFGFDDIQIASAVSKEYKAFNGKFVSQIAREVGMSPFDTYVDLIRKSEGTARVLMHKYSNEDIICSLMKHPASLFMTDAWGEPDGLQNPGAYGSFPRFLQFAREKGVLTLEEAVRKMTGAGADRLRLKKRGYIKKGYGADITVFDWNSVADNTTIEKTDAAPTGIEHVFINGLQVMKNGKVDASKLAGDIL
jgi:N-acyl-D-amino-acid deacylase